ncbi:MAG: hypothetical protein ACOYT4_02860 [Nanoarchaeota archaeon]
MIFPRQKITSPEKWIKSDGPYIFEFTGDLELKEKLNKSLLGSNVEIDYETIFSEKVYSDNYNIATFIGFRLTDIKMISQKR